jgi:hypothetical protein
MIFSSAVPTHDKARTDNRNRMTRAEDLQFSVLPQGPENKWHFFGFAAALNIGRTEKLNHPTRTRIPFAAVNITSATSQFTDSNT